MSEWHVLRLKFWCANKKIAIIPKFKNMIFRIYTNNNRRAKMQYFNVPDMID